MKFTQIVAPEQRSLLHGIPPSQPRIPGYSTRAEFAWARDTLTRPFHQTVGITCRRPDADGSIAVHPRGIRRGEHPGRICAKEFEYVKESPGVGLKTYAWRGQPLAIQRRDASGTWTRVALDEGTEGWVRTIALCR